MSKAVYYDWWTRMIDCRWFFRLVFFPWGFFHLVYCSSPLGVVSLLLLHVPLSVVASLNLVCTLCMSNHPRKPCVFLLFSPTPLHSFRTYQLSSLFVSSWTCRWMIPFCRSWMNLQLICSCVSEFVHFCTVVLLRIQICITVCVFSVLRWFNFFSYRLNIL